MRTTIALIACIAGMLYAGRTSCSSLMLPHAWQPVVLHADFIGTVRCLGNSFTRKIAGSAKDPYRTRVFVKCIVENALKGAQKDERLTLDIGSAKNEFGDKVPSAKQHEQYFVIGYCKWGPPDGERDTQPSAYFLTAYEIYSWAPLPWSQTQTANFMTLHGSDHSSMENFVADTKTVLALSPDEQEYTAIKAEASAILREKFPRIESGDLTEEEAAIFKSRNLQETINALLAFEITQTIAKEVLLDSAGPNALSLIENERDPKAILPWDFLDKLKRHVEWRASSCAQGHQP
jgi:hypothetical protein